MSKKQQKDDDKIGFPGWIRDSMQSANVRKNLRMLYGMQSGKAKDKKYQEHKYPAEKRRRQRRQS